MFLTTVRMAVRTTNVTPPLLSVLSVCPVLALNSKTKAYKTIYVNVSRSKSKQCAYFLRARVAMVILSVRLPSWGSIHERSQTAVTRTPVANRSYSAY